MTETRFAKIGNAHIAYRTFGEGPIDLVFFERIPVDMLDEEPRRARSIRRLSSFCRQVVINMRGFGLSDPPPDGPIPTTEQLIEDGVTVLDALGTERASVFGWHVVSHEVAIPFAVSRPERVASLVLCNARARTLQAPDYPIGVDPSTIGDFSKRMTDPNERELDILAMFAPSAAGDDRFRAWWDTAGHRGASPSVARAASERTMHNDVRELLGRITSPTLVIQRSDVAVLPVALGRYLADNIPGARLVEVPGNDLLWWVGDADLLLDEVEAFLTGTTGATPKRERMLATLLFADVVASTQRAAEIGDQRWRELLQTYHDVISREIERFGGKRVSTDGDGVLAIFQMPADGIRCGAAAVHAVRALGVDLRAGVHTGEVEVVVDDVAGIGVHIAARVMAAGGAGELFVSRTVVDLVAGSGIEFEDRGEFELKGVPGTWRLFALKP